MQRNREQEGKKGKKKKEMKEQVKGKRSHHLQQLPLQIRRKNIRMGKVMNYQTRSNVVDQREL